MMGMRSSYFSPWVIWRQRCCNMAVSPTVDSYPNCARHALTETRRQFSLVLPDSGHVILCSAAQYALTEAKWRLSLGSVDLDDVILCSAALFTVISQYPHLLFLYFYAYSACHTYRERVVLCLKLGCTLSVQNPSSNKRHCH